MFKFHWLVVPVGHSTSTEVSGFPQTNSRLRYIRKEKVSAVIIPELRWLLHDQRTPGHGILHDLLRRLL